MRLFQIRKCVHLKYENVSLSNTKNASISNTRTCHVRNVSLLNTKTLQFSNTKNVPFSNTKNVPFSNTKNKSFQKRKGIVFKYKKYGLYVFSNTNVTFFASNGTPYIWVKVFKNGQSNGQILLGPFLNTLINISFTVVLFLTHFRPMFSFYTKKQPPEVFCKKKCS